jgi:flavin-dependent dehydrogenase
MAAAQPLECDVLVVGSGPAGSIAALVLARGGVRVALVDKAPFPREKACGDLIGPRGVQLLRDLTLDVPDALRVSDMIVVGPTGNRVRLPASPGRTYPGYAIVVQRSTFDAMLQRAAIEAGAEFFAGRAGEPIGADGQRCPHFVTAVLAAVADPAGRALLLDLALPLGRTVRACDHRVTDLHLRSR